MRDLRERLMYLTLLLVFISVGIMIYIALTFGHKLDTQLEQVTKLNIEQQRTIDELKRGIDDVKNDNQQNTQYLRCIISLHSSGASLVDDSCVVHNVVPPSAQPQTTETPAPSKSSEHPQTTQPQNAQPTPAEPQRNNIEKILDVATGLFN